jgi:hypothetical protein
MGESNEWRDITPPPDPKPAVWSRDRGSLVCYVEQTQRHSLSFTGSVREEWMYYIVKVGDVLLHLGNLDNQRGCIVSGVCGSLEEARELADLFAEVWIKRMGG